MTKKVVDPIPVIVYRKIVDCLEDYPSIGYLMDSKGGDKRHEGLRQEKSPEGFEASFVFRYFAR